MGFFANLFRARPKPAINEKLSADMARRIESASADIVHRLTPPPPEPPPPPPRPWTLIGVLLAVTVVAAVLGVFLLRYQGEIVGLRATIDRQAAALAAVPAAAVPAAGGPWPSERHPLGFGDAPFTSVRLTQLSSWLAALEQRGFVGNAHIVVSLADYCLAGNPGEGFAMAPAEMKVTDCDQRGSPADELRPAAEREPAPLKAMLAALDERTHGEIKADVEYVKATGYPAAGANAGQWNAAAAKGHYLEFVPRPRTP